jgi:hypothetical protein
MLRTFKLYTGSDGASHVAEGSVAFDEPSDVVSIYFKESPPHSPSTGMMLPSAST